MKKFDIVKMELVESVGEFPYIDVRIRVHPDSLNYDGRANTCNTLRSLIESNFSTDEWCRVSAAFTDYTVFSGRGNGKTRYFSDWFRYAISSDSRFAIKQVIFNNPATIILWADGTKTVVKCQDGDQFIPETGIAMCFMKKALGNKSNFNNTFKKHVPSALVAHTLSKGNLDKQLELVNNGKKKITKSYAHLNSETIYRILREHKWTVPEFAEYSGVHVTSVYAWLRGKGITSKNLSKLVKVLHVSEEVLIND